MLHLTGLDPATEGRHVVRSHLAAADDLHLPTSLAWLRDVDDGRAWLRSLPTLLAEACSRWSLTLGEPYSGSSASVVLPAERDGDSSLVLKLQFPHRESDHEPAALRAWDGNGAVRLIDDAPDLGALLVERCVPGTHLAAWPTWQVIDLASWTVRAISP